MNQGWIYHDQVSAQNAGQRLLDFYEQRYRHSSRAEWLERIRRGQITVMGQPGSAEQVLRVGEPLAYHRQPWQEPTVPLAFEILYEDADLLAIAKPAGLPVLPGGNFLEHTLLHQLKLRYPHATPTPVHRLGRGTSGIMLLARSPLAKRELSRQFRHTSHPFESPGTVRKIYQAWVGTGDLPDSFAMQTPIGPVPYPVLGTVHAATPRGKPAYSQARVLERRPHQTIVEVQIFTGRPHQIRIHLAAAGFPLVGDPFYIKGGHPRPTPQDWSVLPVPGDIGYYLHAAQLTFYHPRTQQSMTLNCLPPP
ncbi:MAG: RluA family pseudouridine synthase [Leptolyngbyaceae cyanobacterium]